MENKQIQEQRMRGYFIQAAKEMLKGEGLKSINVRRIAERAGYSYATLYNYFKDINDLIFECVKDFQSECEEYVLGEVKNCEPGAARIKAVAKSYLKYFVQYPGTFELFFIERISDIGNKQQTIESICTSLDKLCLDDWIFCIDNKMMTVNEAGILKDQIRYLVIGLLLAYLNRRFPDNYSEFMETVETQLRWIMDRQKV